MKTRTRTESGAGSAPWMKSQERLAGTQSTHSSDIPRSGGGRRQNVGAGIIQVNGRSYWPPAGLPVPHYEDKEKMVMKAPGESYLKKGEDLIGIFFAEWQGFFGHSVKKLGDLSFLPPKLDRTTAKNRTHLLYKSYPCTYAESATPDGSAFPELVIDGDTGKYGPVDGPWESYDPTKNGWTECTDPNSGRDLWIWGSLEDSVVSVSETADGAWEVNLPKLLPFPKSWMTSKWEDLQFALYLGHSALLWSQTCGFCAQQRWESINKVKKDDQRVWRPTAQILMPFFSTGWLFGRPHKTDPEKAGDFRFDGNQEPEGDEVAIRAGFRFFRVRHKTRYMESKDFQNFGKHIAKIECVCKNCLDDGKKRYDLKDSSGREVTNPHEIVPLSLRCPSCNSEVVDRRIVRRAELYAPMEYDKETREPLIEKAGLHQLKYMQHECPDCGTVAYPEVEVQCTTCDDPQPLQLHEVMTRARCHSEGGHYEFSIFETEDGRIYWEDYTDLPISNPAGECNYADTVEDVIRPYLDLADKGEFQEAVNCVEGEDYATKEWTPHQQVAFIDGDVPLFPAEDHSEAR